jgi:hypothetical protein
MRKTSVITAAVLAAVAALHVVWAFSSWPLPDRRRYAEVVVGVTERELPGTGLTLLVAALLAVAAALVAGRGGAVRRWAPAWVHRWGAWTVAAVLLLRGLAGLAVSGLGLGAAPEAFRQWDLAVYSPLCVLLGAAVAVVAARGEDAPAGQRPSAATSNSRRNATVT